MRAHTNPYQETRSLAISKNYVTIFIIVISGIFASTGMAQQADTSPENIGLITEVNDVNALTYPCMAEIIGDDVNIRSGPGTNYYRCGKLNKGDKVEAVSSQFGWCRIVPPVGCFSWISMQYVSVNLADPTVGIVTGDGARVYAGSDYVKPIHSTAEQLKLDRGETIKLLGEEKDDYYKIAPPAGAYLWVSSKYVKLIESDKELLLVTPPSTGPETTESAVPDEGIEAKKLEEFHALQEKIDSERAKPILQQNYREIIKALTEIANNKEAGKAARYAELMIKQMECCELATVVAKEIQNQDNQLQQIKQRIEKARSNRLAEVSDLGRYAVIGKFQSSNIYNAEGESRRYRIVNDSGMTICYVKPTGEVLNKDLSTFIGTKVGLVGTIEPHPSTGGALVQFTEIVKLK